MGKVSIWKVPYKYYRTLRDNRNGNVYLPDVLWQIVFPVVGYVAYGVFRFFGVLPVGDGNVSANIVTIVSIVSALLCGAAVMVFQLRFDIIESDVLDFARNDELTVIDEIYDDMLWAITEGFAIAAVLTMRGVFHDRLADCILVSFALCLFVNFCLVLMMCLKRMSRAYEFVSKDWTKARGHD